MLYSAYYNSPIGRLLLASDGKNLTGLWIEKQKYYADTVPDDIQERFSLRRANGLINIFRVKIRLFPSCRWLPAAENFGRRYGKFYAKSRKGRF